jgi:Tfp pilus assembly protein PilN
MAKAWATGVCVRPDGLEWTVLRRAKESWDVHSRGAAAFAPAEGEEAAPPAVAMDWDKWTAEALKPHLKSMRGRISVVLPQDQALVRVETFPSGDADELYGMAGLQVDKLSPFPEEETATGVETLECAEAESLVALAIVRADAVERAGAPFLELGSLPDAVDVEPLAWWWGAKKLLGESPRGGRIVLRAEASGRIAMAVAHGGRPIAFGALPPLPPDGADGEWLEEAAEEAGYALTALESAWGSEASLRMTVAAPKEMDVSWASSLAKTLGAGVPEIVPSEDLPTVSEGAARRLAEPAEPLSMDLAPAAWREEDERRRGNRGLMVAATVFVALWLLALGVFFAVLNVRRARLSELEGRVAELEKPAAEVRRLRAKVMDFAAYADRSRSALECLRAMSEALPPGVELNSFIYRKGASLTLRGESPDSERIYEFTRGLDESGLFDDVKSDGINMKQGGGGGSGALYTFGITAALPGGGDDAEGGAP